MAKKQTVDPNMFAKTEQAPMEPVLTEPAPDPVRPVGIGLKDSEWQRLEVIADELGVTRHTLSLWILRDFIKRFNAGWRPETDPKRVLRI